MSSYEDIASLLKRVRLSHGLSTSDLARHIHIRERYIVALEMGEVETLPGSAYARAYIERILIFLQHDPAEALIAFDAATEEPSRKLFQLSMRWGNSPHPTPQFALVSLAAALLILVVWNLTHPQETAPLVDVFPTKQEALPTTNPPKRCTDTGQGMLPCYWEELKTWTFRHPR